jgi:hypothetical protein
LNRQRQAAELTVSHVGLLGRLPPPERLEAASKISGRTQREAREIVKALSGDPYSQPTRLAAMRDVLGRLEAEATDLASEDLDEVLFQQLLDHLREANEVLLMAEAKRPGIS